MSVSDQTNDISEYYPEGERSAAEQAGPEPSAVSKDMKVTSIILTGGKNLRMGRNKALETIAGKTLLERVYTQVKPVSDEVIMVTSQHFPDIKIDGDYSVVVDIYPEKGPMGGLYTGMLKSKGTVNIVVACDMPFLNTELLKHMTELSAGYDAVVPQLSEGMKEPLHAVYSSRCVDIVGERLQQSLLSVHSFIDTINVRYVDKDEILKFDPDLLSFFDINYPSDLERAAIIAKKLEG